MLSLAKREYITLAALAALFAAFLIPSLLEARARVRDGLRKEDITYLKRSLEDYYNRHEIYPAVSKDCITTAEPEDWPFVETLPYDVREDRGFFYRYCATGANERGTMGYYLEARLEVGREDGTYFDEDERRKFHYRILHDGRGRTWYRVCGGQEKQCQKD